MLHMLLQDREHTGWCAIAWPAGGHRRCSDRNAVAEQHGPLRRHVYNQECRATGSDLGRPHILAGTKLETVLTTEPELKSTCCASAALWASDKAVRSASSRLIVVAGYFLMSGGHSGGHGCGCGSVPRPGFHSAWALERIGSIGGSPAGSLKGSSPGPGR